MKRLNAKDAEVAQVGARKKMNHEDHKDAQGKLRAMARNTSSCCFVHFVVIEFPALPAQPPRPLR